MGLWQNDLPPKSTFHHDVPLLSIYIWVHHIPQCRQGQNHAKYSLNTYLDTVFKTEQIHIQRTANSCVSEFQIPLVF